MTKMNVDSFLTPSPKKYVESALRYVGYARHTTGFLPHSVMQFIVQFLSFVSPSFGDRFMMKRVRTARDKLFKATE